MSKQLDWPYVINLGNSILGVSVLAMPFCFRQCGVMLGVLLLLASAWLTGVACELLMKSAVTSKKRSYEYLALHTFGPLGKLAVEVSIIGMLLGTCVAFHVVIGDLGPGIISKILGIENTTELRTTVMVVLCLFIGLPLGLLKNIESLSNVSAISIGFYMVFVAEVFASAFPNLWSGIWVAKVEVWNPEGVFKCLPIFSLAFGCQTQLFVMYDALPEPSMKRMNSISKNAISLCTGVYLLVGFFGYIAFCDEPISGDILVNFRPTIFSEAVKLGFVMSIAVSFPLVIFPCRTSIHTLLFAKVSEEHTGTHENFGGSPLVPEPHFKLITIVIVLSTLVVGIYLPNIEFILAMTGATMGSMICYIFPAVLFITLMSMSKNSSKSTAQLVLFLGVTILLASTYTTLYAQDQRIPDTVESVVKIAEPQPVQQADKAANEDSMGAGDNPDQLSNENIKKDGDDVIKDTGKAKLEEKKPEESKPVEAQKDDKRQEPPNPHAPVDDDIPVKDDVKEEVKPEEKTADVQSRDKKQDDLSPEKDIEKQSNENIDDKKESHVDEQDKIDMKQKTNATNEKAELKEAKVLLEELKEQRDEQKKLLDAQRELINELKQHQKDAHPNKEEQKAVDAEGQNAGFQRAGGVAPHGAGTPLVVNVKEEVEQEVAKVVKNAVGAQQEEQLHNIAKQNHQEMLESLDDQKQQQVIQQPLPADVNNVGGMQPNVQQAGQGVQLQQQQQQHQQQQQLQQQGLDAAGNNQQMGQVNFMQQQQQQAGGLPEQVGIQQQPKVQGVGNNVGIQPQVAGQQQQQPVQGFANNLKDTQVKQSLDAQEALKYVQQQGFLPDQHIQQDNAQEQPVEVQKPVQQNVGQQVQVNNPVQGQPLQQVQGQIPVEQPFQQQLPQGAALPNANKPIGQNVNQQVQKQNEPAVQQQMQQNVMLPNSQNIQNPKTHNNGLKNPRRNKR